MTDFRHTNLYLLTLSIAIAGLLQLIPKAAFSAHNVELPVELTSSTILNNHTARIELDSTTPGFDWSLACNDITVVDSVSAALPFFVQTCDTTNQFAILWILLPVIPASPASVEIMLRYNDPGAISLSNANATFIDSGFKYHTQPYNNATPGPESRTDGDAIFNYDVVTTAAGYGCTQLNNVNVDNSGVFGSNSNIAYHIITFLDVVTAGDYEFRYGNDYGHGGELTIDSTPLEADWSNDLWWGFNYNNPDVLTGSVTLASQTYTLDALGFELCCDGPGGLQYRILPLGPWTDLTTTSTDLNLLAPDCPREKHRLKIADHRTAAELAIVKSVSDTSPSIGDTVRFTLTVENNAIHPAVNFIVTDNIPAGFNSVSNISHSGALTGNSLQWVIPSLAMGGSINLTFDAVVQ